MTNQAYPFGFPTHEVQAAKEELAKYLPYLSPKYVQTPFWVQGELDFWVSEKDERIAGYEWRNLYDMAMQKLGECLFGRDEYFIIRCIPTKTKDIARFTYVMRLYLEIMVMPINEEMKIPKFIYYSREDKLYVGKWNCGSCQSPNAMYSKRCNRCGRLRAMLFQEIE